jgi:hypothetical protein
MTAAAEAAVALARDEAAVTLARETVALLGDLAGMIDTIAEWGDHMIAGGAPAKAVAHQMIYEARLLADAARGEPATR